MNPIAAEILSIIRPKYQHFPWLVETTQLSAHLYRASPHVDRLVIISHGFNEDQTLQGMAIDYITALLNAGLSVLTYDFAGFGKSDAELVSLASGVADLKAIIDHAQKQLTCSAIGLFGHSFGGAASLACYSNAIAAIVTIGGVTGAMPFPMDRIFLPDQWTEFKEKGYANEYRTYGTRPNILVSPHILQQMTELNQKTLLSRIDCPVLLIHGDAEAEERALYNLSKQGLPYLGSTASLHCIAGADHNFRGFTQQVNQLLVPWFMRYLTLS